MTDALLLRIALAVEGLRADLVALHPSNGTQKLSASDREALTALLPPVAGELGSEPFHTTDLLEVPALTIVLGGRTAKTLGRLLARGEGVPVAGYVCRRAGRQTWEVLAVVSGRL